jgi:hypothetical protein
MVATHTIWPSLSAVAVVLCGGGGMTDGSPAAASGGTATFYGSSAPGGGMSVGGMANAVGTGESTAGTAASPCASPGIYVHGLCGTTTAGVPVAKSVSCTDADQQVCDKSCGPGGSGYKTETCTAGVYVEGSCVFPANCWYGCFRVPTADSPGCPATLPQHGQPCSLAICNVPCPEMQTTPCEICGVANGYLDSSGNPKAGYCVCVAAPGGGRQYACGVIPGTWPCPAGDGC